MRERNERHRVAKPRADLRLVAAVGVGMQQRHGHRLHLRLRHVAHRALN